MELEGKGKGGKGRVCDERGENERDITVITVTVNQDFEFLGIFRFLAIAERE